MIGDIMGINRIRTDTDGMGITTLVTFFDCPLHCKYCINDFCHDPLSQTYESAPRASYTPEELVEVLKKDDIYYRMTDGGVTYGGGEPLLQSAFIHEVVKLSPKGWKHRIETSLNVPWRYLESIIDDMDEWIIDIKDMDDTVYQKYTGVENKYVRNNLNRMVDLIELSRIRIRIPRIPDYNNPERIRESIEEIQENYQIEPEVFDYIKVPKCSTQNIDTTN